MSHKKRVLQTIIIIAIAAILFTTAALKTVQANKAEPNTVGIATLPGTLVRNNDPDTVEYSDALALFYANQYNNKSTEAPSHSSWDFENADAFDYSNDMALKYASRFTNSAEEANALVSSWNFTEAEVVEYSDALALEYARRFMNEDNTNQRFSWNFEDADAFAYSDALALQYAEKNSK